VLIRNVTLNRADRAAADQAALREDRHGRATNRLWAQTPAARLC